MCVKFIKLFCTEQLRMCVPCRVCACVYVWTCARACCTAGRDWKRETVCVRGRVTSGGGRGGGGNHGVGEVAEWRCGTGECARDGGRCVLFPYTTARSSSGGGGGVVTIANAPRTHTQSIVTAPAPPISIWIVFRRVSDDGWISTQPRLTEKKTTIASTHAEPPSWALRLPVQW